MKSIARSRSFSRLDFDEEARRVLDLCHWDLKKYKQMAVVQRDTGLNLPTDHGYPKNFGDQVMKQMAYLVKEKNKPPEVTNGEMPPTEEKSLGIKSWHIYNNKVSAMKGQLFRLSNELRSIGGSAGTAATVLSTADPIDQFDYLHSTLEKAEKDSHSKKMKGKLNRVKRNLIRLKYTPNGELEQERRVRKEEIAKNKTEEVPEKEEPEKVPMPVPPQVKRYSPREIKLTRLKNDITALARDVRSITNDDHNNPASILATADPIDQYDQVKQALSQLYQQASDGHQKHRIQSIYQNVIRIQPAVKSLHKPAHKVEIGDVVKHPLKDWAGWWKVIEKHPSAMPDSEEQGSVLFKLANPKGHQVPCRIDAIRKVKVQKSLSDPDPKYATQAEWENKNFRKVFEEQGEQQPTEESEGQSPATPKQPKKKKPVDIPSSTGEETQDLHRNQIEAIHQQGKDHQEKLNVAFSQVSHPTATPQAKKAAEQIAHLLGMGVGLGANVFTFKKGAKFNTPLDYIKTKGQAFLGSPLPPGVRRGTPKECYENATKLVLSHPDWTYVEGFAMRQGLIPVLHAWALTPDGKVVDNTWDDPEHSAYFGVVYDRDKYLKYIIRKKHYGIMGGTNKHAEEILHKGDL